MIAVIEDSESDYYLLTQVVLNGVEHKRYYSLSSFKLDEDNYDFSCVILDLSLPECVGGECVIGCQNIYSGNIIVLTGMGGSYADKEVFKSIRDLGVTHVFQKHKMNSDDYLNKVKEAIHV